MKPHSPNTPKPQWFVTEESVGFSLFSSIYWLEAPSSLEQQIPSFPPSPPTPPFPFCSWHCYQLTPRRRYLPVQFFLFSKKQIVCHTFVSWLVTKKKPSYWNCLPFAVKSLNYIKMHIGTTHKPGFTLPPPGGIYNYELATHFPRSEKVTLLLHLTYATEAGRASSSGFLPTYLPTLMP